MQMCWIVALLSSSLKFRFWDSILALLRMRRQYRFDSRPTQFIFLFCSVSTPALGLTQLPVQWIREVVLQNVQTGSGAHPGFYSKNSLDVVLIAIFHLAMRLSVSADKGVLPLHSFVALAGTTLLLLCFFFLSLSEFSLILNSWQN